MGPVMRSFQRGVCSLYWSTFSAVLLSWPLEHVQFDISIVAKLRWNDVAELTVNRRSKVQRRSCMPEIMREIYINIYVHCYEYKCHA